MYTLLYTHNFLYSKLEMPHSNNKSHLRIVKDNISKEIRLSSNDSKLNIDNKHWKRILRVMIILPFQEYLRKRHRTCMMNFKELHYVFVKKC